MAQRIEFASLSKKNLKKFILKSGKKTIFNFLNLYSVYLYKKNKDFRRAIENVKKDSITIADGSIVSIFLGIKRIRGTDFTMFLMEDKDLMKNKKHFFLGSDSANGKGVGRISSKFSLDKSKVFYYNPPYIRGNKFPKEEVEKISRMVNGKKIDYLWVGVGNPKQEILAGDLYGKVNVKFIFNVGAALDFIAGKKKESPKTIQRFGLEWLYRGITDLKHSRKKIVGSFKGLFYLPRTVIVKGNLI